MIRLVAFPTAALLAVLFPLPYVAAQEASEPTRVEEAVGRRKAEIKEALNRPGVTGGWFGASPWLAERGIRFEAAVTGFAQDPFAGSGGSTGDMGGKIDGLLNLNLQKLGLWEGLRLTAHPEYNFGDAANGFGGTVIPVNVAMQLPGVTSGNRYDTSSLFLTQRFNETFTLIVGKTNLADVAAFHPYSGGAGLSGFMNAGLAAAPNGAIPPYVYGVMLIAKTKRAVFNAGVYGGNSARGTFSFQDAFESGQLFSLGVSVPVKPLGLPGKQRLSVIFGDRDAASLQSLGDLIPPGGATRIQSLSTRRYVLGYDFRQALCTWDEESRSMGIWGRANLNDNELSAIAWSVAGGVGGDSPIRSREADRWGAGGFYYSFADFLRSPETVTIPLRDEYGLEIFYNAALTSWLRLTADLQVIRPGVPDQPTAVVGGLRVSLRF